LRGGALWVTFEFGRLLKWLCLISIVSGGPSHSKETPAKFKRGPLCGGGGGFSPILKIRVKFIICQESRSIGKNEPYIKREYLCF